MKFIKRQQSGFTLVEIAIVLVIIGLLLGGVLKGQEMIENSRIKSVVADMRGISAAYTGYFDRYHAYAGDENIAVPVARGWGALGGGNGNGITDMLVANTFTNAAGTEQAAMWQVLRASNFLSGNPASVGVAGLPVAGTGGLIGAAQAPYAMAGPGVCVSNLTHKQASGVDVILDGTLPITNIGNNVGIARGAIGAAPFAPSAVAPAGIAYNESLATTWTMCRPIL